MRIRLWLAAVLAPACGEAPPRQAVPPPPPPVAVYAWTQLGPDDHVFVRAVVPGGARCPEVVVDGAPRPMRERVPASPATKPAFSVSVCELDLASANGIVVEGRKLGVPAREYRRIVVLGDTGCRIKVPAQGRADPIQDCNDPKVWPWARMAAAAASKGPDLIVHVGDYQYRDACDHGEACKKVRAAGTIVDYGWAGWEADFFKPAGALLAAAPWVMTRGNHENCERGGEGWQRFLSPVAYQPCPDQKHGSGKRSLPSTNLTHAGYRVQVAPGLSFFVIDNAAVEEGKVASAVEADARAELDSLAAFRSIPAGDRVWLVGHKPIWFDLLPADKQPNAWQAAARAGLGPQVDLMFAGHEHVFQTLTFARAADPGFPGGRPAQVVVGSSGSQLEAGDPSSPFYEGAVKGSKERSAPDGKMLYEGAAAASGIVLSRFAFLLLERRGDGWDGTVFDENGEAITKCRPEAEKRFECAFPRPK